MLVGEVVVAIVVPRLHLHAVVEASGGSLDFERADHPWGLVQRPHDGGLLAARAKATGVEIVDRGGLTANAVLHHQIGLSVHAARAKRGLRLLTLLEARLPREKALAGVGLVSYLRILAALSHLHLEVRA